MTLATPPALRIVTFGDLDSGVWGAVWSTAQAGIALRAGDADLRGPAELDAGDETGSWKLNAKDVDMTIVPLGEAIYNEALDGFDQLARIHGQATLSGNTVSIQGLCRRSARHLPDLDNADSVRDVSCWFEPDRGLALTALRPRKTKGHDRDVIAAAVLDLEDGHRVADPRLSTTYDETGLPARAGLELWRTDEEEEEQHYPTRAAGEAAGAELVSSADGAEVLAKPFRWHSRGADGTGVYLVIRPR